MRVRTALRRIALVATTATLFAGAPVTAAQAAADTVTNVSPVSGANTNALTVQFDTAVEYLTVPKPTVTFARAADTSDTIVVAADNVTVAGKRFTVTVPLTRENPGAWNISASGMVVGGTEPVVNECAGCFTVFAFPPTATAVSPATVGGGASGVPFTITGTNFTNDVYCSVGACTGEPTVTVSGSGVTLTGRDSDNSGDGDESIAAATSIAKRINVAAGAATGPRDVTVTNTDGKTATCTGCLVIGATPTLTAVTPGALARNVTRNVVLTGSNFVPGAVVAITLPGTSQTNNSVTVGTPVIDSPTQITVPVTVADNASVVIGDRNVTVTNPDQGSVTRGDLFDVTPKPTVSGVTYTANTGVNQYGQGAFKRVLTIAGTGFQQGAVVTFANPAGITVNSTTVTSATAIAVELTLDQRDSATAPAVAKQRVTVTNVDGGVSTEAHDLTVSTGPKLNTVSPNSRGRGETVTLTLSGANFHTGGITVEIPDVTVTGTTVTNATTATVTGVVASGINVVGPRDVTVTNNNDKGRYVCAGCFEIATLQVNGISPANVLNDSTQSFTLTGSGFATDAVATLVMAGLDPITGTTTSVNSLGTSMTATFPLTGVAPGGWRPRVTNPSVSYGSGTCECALTVVAPAPDVTGVSPNVRGAGSDDETITITGTGFAPGATVTFSNPGIRLVGAPTVTPTQITAVIDIDRGSEPNPMAVPPPPAETVTVKNTDNQNDSATFTVQKAPTATGLDKTSRARGTATTITLSGDDLVSGATLLVSGTGVTPGTATFTDGNGVTTKDTLVATFTVAPDALLGARTVTVRNPDGGRHTCGTACTLTINEAPTVTSVSPAKLATGKATTVTVTGTGFVSGATVAAGDAVTAGTATVTSPTTLTVALTPAAGAALGNRGLTVTNTDAGSATLADALKVITVPGKPTAVSATRGAGAATVTWTAPATDGNDPITGYTVTSSPGAKTATVGADATEATVSGLTNGTAYTFTVVATNAAGDGAASDASAPVTPATVPDAPTAVSATSENAQSTVSWTAPASNGGDAVTGYTVTASPGGKTATVNGSTLTAVVAGLTNGTAYTFTVVAANTVGDSAASAPSTAVTPATVPDAPGGVSAAASDASALVTWTAPVSDGGAPVTSYTVTSSPGNHTATTPNGSTLSATVAGLTNGTKYTFTVVATNAKGASAASTASPEVTPFTIAGAPTGVTATAGNAEATVTWTAPASDNGSAVTGYTVTATPGGKTATVDGSTLTAVVTGLTNGTQYAFTVVATNAAGNSAASAESNAVTPATVPDAPTAVSATPGNGLADVTWTAPAGNGGSEITGYTVTASPGGATATADAASTGAVVEGLANGTAYTFTVVATNAKGASAASAPSAAVTPFTKPAAPAAVTATAGNALATVTWEAPADNGSAITGYTVTSDPGGKTATVDGSTLTADVTGLTNGTAYTFTVVAANAAGDSPASAASTAVTPATVPDAPTAVSATPSNGAAYVTWTAPAGTGGSDVTGYTVTSDPGGHTATVGADTLAANVTGLANGTAYTFTVVATNAKGDSVASAASDAVTPYTIPGAPTAVSATPADSAANVAWAAPESDGGSAITGYTVTVSPGGETVNVGGDVLGATVPGLVNGTAYTFTVTAANAAGAGPASAESAAVTPRTVPGAPTGVTATRGDGQATVTWTAPESTGGAPVTGYTVTSAPGGKTATVDASTFTADVTGLTNGTAYTFTVVATNEAGDSAASTESGAVTPAGLPKQPKMVGATPGHASATVGWQAADGNGSPVTGYTVTAAPGGATKTVTGQTATFTGLANGVSYTFTVTATNALGTGPGATSAPVVPTWATKLTEASTKTIVSGGTARVIGRLTRSDGTGLVNAPVKIYRKVAPATTYSYVRTVTTGTGGAWSTSFTLTKNTRFQAKFAGVEGYDAAVSPIRLTSVAYRVSAAYSLSGRTVTAYGGISPNASGRTVYLRHRRADGGYDYLASARVGSTGRYKIVKTLARGKYSLSTYLPASSTNIAGKSPQRAVTI